MIWTKCKRAGIHLRLFTAVATSAIAISPLLSAQEAPPIPPITDSALGSIIKPPIVVPVWDLSMSYAVCSTSKVPLSTKD
jgi:hypothetical protein